MTSFFSFDKLKKKLPFLYDHNNHNGNGGSGQSFLSPFTKSAASSGGGGGRGKQRPGGHNLILDKDPEQVWEVLGEIGDGAFGKVYKARNRQTGVLAAAKIVEKCTEDELEDYMIEIDILSECRHKNIVQIYEAYFFNQKLWVGIFFLFVVIFGSSIILI